jgi:hypothetical protein
VQHNEAKSFALLSNVKMNGWLECAQFRRGSASNSSQMVGFKGKMHTIESVHFEDDIDRRLHDDDLQTDSDDQHAHEDGTGEDALKDVILVQNLAGVDFIAHLHEDEGIEQQTLAGDLVLFLNFLVKTVRVVKCIENLHRKELAS